MIKEKAGESRRPVFEERDKSARFEVGRDIIVQKIRQPQTIADRADGKLDVVDDQPPFDSGVQDLAVFFKVPAEDRAVGQTIADAVVMTQIARCLGPGMLFQIIG